MKIETTTTTTIATRPIGHATICVCRSCSLVAASERAAYVIAHTAVPTVDTADTADVKRTRAARHTADTADTERADMARADAIETSAAIRAMRDIPTGKLIAAVDRAMGRTSVRRPSHTTITACDRACHTRALDMERVDYIRRVHGTVPPTMAVLPSWPLALRSDGGTAPSGSDHGIGQPQDSIVRRAYA